MQTKLQKSFSKKWSSSNNPNQVDHHPDQVLLERRCRSGQKVSTWATPLGGGCWYSSCLYFTYLYTVFISNTLGRMLVKVVGFFPSVNSSPNVKHIFGLGRISWFMIYEWCTFYPGCLHIHGTDCFNAHLII